MEKMLMWKQGQWGECDDLLAGIDANEEFGSALSNAGWTVKQAFGPKRGYGFGFRVLSNPDVKGFLIDIDDVSSSYQIHVPSFPDLIDLLSKLSPIAIASALADDEVAEFVSNFVSRKRKEDF